MKKLASIVAMLISVIALSGGTALAATGAANGFQVAPVVNEFAVSKGQSRTTDITVTNPTNASVVAEAKIDDFVASANENGTPRILTNGQVADPSHNFISLVKPIANVSIPAKGSVQVPVTISVPSNANSGGYYGAVLFQAASTSGHGNVALTANVGSLFLITVPGNLIEKLEVVQLAAANNGKATGIFLSGQPQMLLRLQNTGDIQLQPFGTINVKNMAGKIIATQQFNSTTPRSNVLPSSIRRFVSNLPKRTWFGHYTIQANIAYANGSGSVLTASAGFWYFPTWFVIVAVIIIIALVVLIYWLIGKNRRSKHGNRR